MLVIACMQMHICICKYACIRVHVYVCMDVRA